MHLIFIILFLLGLSGCSVGPKYQQPEISMPLQFEQLSNEESNAEESLSHWWRQFDDPILDKLIEEALSANYDLRIALEKIEQTRAQYRIERSHLWPEIDLNATATRTRISKNFIPSPPEGEGAAGKSSFPPLFLNIFEVGFDAIWELDLFGKLRHAKKAAHYLWQATKEDYQSVLISLISEVAINYISLRALQEKIALTQKKIQADEEELIIAKSLLDVGIDNEIQISTLISTIQTDYSQLPPLNSSIKQTIYGLAYLLGREPEGMTELFEDIRPIPTAAGKLPIGIPSDLLRRRPDVRSAERQLAAATEQTGAAVAEYFPSFSLAGISFTNTNKGGSSFGLESSRISKLFESASRMLSFGLGMNWDLLDFGRVRGNVDVKNSLQRQALLTYEQTVIGSLRDVESALVAYFEEQLRRESLLKKVAADQRTYEINRDLLKVGLANETQVIESKKNWIESQKSLVESNQFLAGDLIAIYKALGGNWNPPK